MTPRRQNRKPKIQNPAPNTEYQTPNTDPTRVDFTEIRTGEDTRQRGWFWHWNELHTEYEPLLKHSGIGLITSYIVWTDRREGSPYRGYAFPSLNSQAAFSGSDRAELITINQILVALDLIEIRKEMVMRVDEQGRKWRVPHNLYRVKDRSGDPHLTAADVERVLRLAGERKDVYRHVRHILTSGFVPISRTNIWHGILEELRPTELWQRLAAQATEEEARLSQRSRNGHAARKSGVDAAPSPDRAGKGGKDAPQPVDESEIYVPGAGDPETPVAVTSTRPGEAGQTMVASTNRGLATSVERSNDGSVPDRQSTDGPINRGRRSMVAPTNPMYHQSRNTTSTRNGAAQGKTERAQKAVTAASSRVTEAVTTPAPALAQAAAGPGEHIAPEHGPDRQAALGAFQEANGRPATAAEMRLLGGIAAGVSGESGWKLVAAAIYAAVDSGSAFVAPKRVRQIVQRWANEGLPAEVLALLVNGGDPAARGEEPKPVVIITGGRDGARESGSGSGSDTRARTPRATTRRPSSERTEPAGRVTSPELPAGQMPVQAVAPTDEAGTSPRAGEEIAPVHTSHDAQPAPHDSRRTSHDSFWIPEASINSERMWAAVIDQLERWDVVRPAEVQDYLRSAVVLERPDARTFRIGVAHQLARQRLERKWRLDICEALAKVLGGANWEIAVEVTGDHRKTA